jgi:predicted RNA binding protein YcfA (HicA-like mRNA interferase family)
MSNWEKLLKQFLENPKNMKYKDIEKLLERKWYKAEWYKWWTSHKKIINLETKKTYTVAIHQKQDCLSVYKTNLKKFYLSNLE